MQILRQKITREHLKAIEFDSLINIRSWQGNRSRDVENESVREQIRKIVSKYISGCKACKDNMQSSKWLFSSKGTFTYPTVITYDTWNHFHASPSLIPSYTMVSVFTAESVSRSLNFVTTRLYIDAAQLDLGFLTVENSGLKVGDDYVNINLYDFVNRKSPRSVNTAYALGNTGIKLLDNKGTISFSGDVCDWDYHKKSPMRNSLIFLERLRTGLDDNHGFKVCIYGTAKLDQT